MRRHPTHHDSSVANPLPRSLFNFDVVTQLCFGRPLGFLDQERDVEGLIEKFSQTLWLGEYLAVQENMSWYLRNTRIGRYLRDVCVSPAQTWGIGGVMRVRDKIIDSLVGPDRKPKGPLTENSLLSRFLAAKNGDGSPMSLQEVKDELLTAMWGPSSDVFVLRKCATCPLTRGVLVKPDPRQRH